ncbi:uncharacterized protein [Eurosta solidaginis]|uniref:uncharacterized protein n=1 Tax=Eurosta solidaginis TaxID=178769 RepID=UPI0035305CBF
MRQHTKLTILLSVITISTLLVQQTTASCGVCNSNGIACISQTEFYICYNNQPDNTTRHECPNQGTCTNLKIKCSEAGNAPADCTPPICGCTANSEMFACTSRTTFAQCNGAQVVTRGSCPTGLLCSSTGGGELCVGECQVQGQIECDLDVPAS